MKHRSRRLHVLLPRALAGALVGLFIAVAGAQGQERWSVVTRSSLSWWQVSPHLNHLWATTCPEEPTWRPGEGRSGGWNIDRDLKTESRTGYQNVADTVHVPLYPRGAVDPDVRCSDAVSGWAVLSDTVGWKRVSGEIAVNADALMSGHDQRDAYMRRAILQTSRFREVKFRLDSVINVTRQGDTLRGTGIGTFTLRDVSQPMNAALVAWPEAGGLRVLGKIRIPARSLVPVYGVSQFALGLGVGTKIWQDLFAGVDMVLRPEGARSGN
jgi:hypothetical protein